MGITLAAVANSAGYAPGHRATLPIEGGVYWRGYGVKEKAGETLNLLIPGHRLTPSEASGITGIAQLALVRQEQLLRRK